MSALPALRRYKPSRLLAIVVLLEYLVTVAGVIVVIAIIIGSINARERFDAKLLPNHPNHLQVIT